MNNTPVVKRFFEYLPTIIRFHKLKSEGLARFIFLAVLVSQLIGNFIQYNLLTKVSSENLDLIISAIAMPTSVPEGTRITGEMLQPLFLVIATTLLVKLVVNLFLSVYMYSYIAELKGKAAGFAASFKGTFRFFGRLIVYNILFGLLILLGLMFFIVPGILAYIVFVFGFCYILDLKLTLADAFTASSDITRGRKAVIFNVLVGFYIMFELPIVLLISGSSLGSAYLASFFSTISSIILQRLITQIYMDLEYRKEVSNKPKA